MMKARLDTHPRWCGQGHLCSADRGGEHRSHPLTFDPPAGAGRIVAIRIRTRGGQDRLEIRAVVDLPAGDQEQARAAAAGMVEQVCRAAMATAPARAGRR